MTLTETGAKYGTDKGTGHSYLDIYEALFTPFQQEKLSILEVGTANGCSLRMWLDWFPNCTVIGIDDNANAVKDCIEQTAHLRKGSGYWSVLQCEQTDDVLLRKLLGDKKFRIIIDDAGHDPKKQMLSFLLLWRCVEPGGFYIVEDIPNDHWADYWDGIPGATVYRNHKDGREDDILVIIRKP